MKSQILSGLALLMLSIGLACTSPLSTTQDEPPDVPTRLYYRIGEAWESHNHMRTVWEQVIDAEEPVSCAETLSVPQSFELTVNEAEEYPATVEVRDHLNLAIEYLEAVSAKWEAECTNQRAYIPILELRDIQSMLDLAKAELIEADYLWSLSSTPSPN